MDKKAMSEAKMAHVQPIAYKPIAWQKYKAWDTKARKFTNSGIFFNNTDMQIETAPGIELLRTIGRKDKYGKDIFEGHIIHYKSERTNTDAIINIVFNEEISAFAMRGLEKWDCCFVKDMKPDELEIIGNIYEGTIFDNPDLLEVRP